MVKYTDYKYYKEVYKGTMPETSFERVVAAASAYIRKITFNRVDVNEVPEEVRYASCVVCDTMNDIDSAKIAGKTVKSETNDGYAVTFVTEADAKYQDSLYSAAALYLEPTGLLSMRCDYDH